MNKKLHIFLFLLLGLMIFVLFKGIEPFGNQVLLQPGLSFNSRDTSIISLQGVSEKDTSEIINNRVTPSRRIPSPMKEREVPSYSIYSDTSDNLDTSADFNSPEEIELLNNRLDNLQSKLDEQSELFLSEGSKRKCTIPRGIYNSYRIIKDGSDGPFDFGVEEGEMYDYDEFENLEIRCVGGGITGVKKAITCGETNEFEFAGCKRTCSIPEGYVIKKNENGTNVYYDNSRGQLDYDHFEDVNSVSCEGNYRADPTSVTASNISCQDSEFVIDGFNCQENITCNPPEKGGGGYLLNGDPILQEDLKFNPFDNTLILEEGDSITCNEGAEYHSVGDAGRSITCDTTGDIAVFSGCKRKCAIYDDVSSTGALPEGYTIDSYDLPVVAGQSRRDESLRLYFDSDLNGQGIIKCTGPDYEVGDPNGADQPSITCPEVEGAGNSISQFTFNGCIKRQCSIANPDDLDKYSFTDVDTEGEYTPVGQSFDYDHFSQYIIGCKSGYSADPASGASITGCRDGIDEFTISGCVENRVCDLPEEVVSEGYLLNEDTIRQEDLKFNPFDNTLILEDGKSINCNTEDNYHSVGDAGPTITCDNPNDDVLFNGCIKRQCSIENLGDLDKYSFTDVDTEEVKTIMDLVYLDDERDTPARQRWMTDQSLDYDHFSQYIIGCRSGYSADPTSGVSITECRDGIDEFTISECVENRVCDLPEGVISEGYLLNDPALEEERMIRQGDLKFNPFDNTLILEDGKNITCNTGENYYSAGDAGPSITCDTTGGIAVFSGCEKQCSIEKLNDFDKYSFTDVYGDGYNPVGQSFDYDHFSQYIIGCKSGYSSPDDEPAPSINNCFFEDGENYFTASGSSRCTSNIMCSLPQDYEGQGDYLIDGEPIFPGSFEFNPFSGDSVNSISCSYERMDPGMRVRMLCSDGRIEFSGCRSR